MKLAMITDYPRAGEPVYGGVQAVSSYLIEALSQIGDLELNVLTFKAGISTAEVELLETHTHYILPFGKYGTLTGFRADQAILNSCLKKIRPDIVHSQGSGHHGILANRSGYPSVVTIHGILTEEARYLASWRRRLRIRAQGWLSDYHCIRQAKNTILISPYVEQFYGGRLAGRRYLIPNPVDPRFFNIDRKEVSGNILFLGRISSLKGIKDLVCATAKLRNISDLRLRLAGPTSDRGYMNEIESAIRQLDLETVVDFLGNLGPHELLDELSRCACLVLPSYQETAPMVIQEAMAAGVPVIASNICGIPYQVRDGVTGFLFPPGNVNSLAQCLNELLSNPELRDIYGQNGRQFANSYYRSDKVACSTLDVYRDVLEQY
jgi:glycosyltransferase involved in cell wall biosynthesis